VGDLVFKPTENFDLHVGGAFAARMHVTASHPVNARQEVEDPPHGRRRGRLVDVARHGLMVLGTVLEKSAWRNGVDQPRAGLAGRAECGRAFAGVACVFGQAGGLHLVIRSALGHRRRGGGPIPGS
jgi:hypothetical protein